MIVSNHRNYLNLLPNELLNKISYYLSVPDMMAMARAIQKMTDWMTEETMKDIDRLGLLTDCNKCKSRRWLNDTFYCDTCELRTCGSCAVLSSCYRCDEQHHKECLKECNCCRESFCVNGSASERSRDEEYGCANRASANKCKVNKCVRCDNTLCRKCAESSSDYRRCPYGFGCSDGGMILG